MYMYFSSDMYIWWSICTCTSYGDQYVHVLHMICIYSGQYVHVLQFRW